MDKRITYILQQMAAKLRRKPTVTITIPPDTLAAIRQQAEAEHRSISQTIALLAERGLSKGRRA